MNSDFIAALIVMVIMTAFAFVILKLIADNTGKRIRDYVINQVQTYETLLQKKEEELSAIKNQIELEQNKLLKQGKGNNLLERELSGVIVTHEADYCNQDFASDYRSLKKRFTFDLVHILGEMRESQAKEQLGAKNQLLESLIQKLTLDTIYKLTAFQSVEQLEIISEIITGGERQLLEEYCNMHREFRCYDFYQWLHVQRKLRNREIFIKTVDKSEGINLKGEGVQLEYDEELCEGFQILLGNKLYDYGVRRSELI